MTRRMVEIDDAALAAARTALGTTTIKATVDAALHAVVAARNARVDEALAAFTTFEFTDPDAEREDAWRRS